MFQVHGDSCPPANYRSSLLATTQYKEHSRTHTHKENGKEIKETEYWYTEEWSDEEIWSSSFDDPSYRNPRVRACRHTTTKLREAHASPQYRTCHDTPPVPSKVRVVHRAHSVRGVVPGQGCHEPDHPQRSRALVAYVQQAATSQHTTPHTHAQPNGSTQTCRRMTHPVATGSWVTFSTRHPTKAHHPLVTFASPSM